jgi:ribosomal protein S21
MKDLDPLVKSQIDMVEDRYGIMRQRVTFKTVHACKHHTWATENDIIDVVINKTKKTVKRCRFCENVKNHNKYERQKELETEKKNLTDYYLRKKLSRGSKLKSHEIPQPLVEVQRVAMQISRLKEKMEAPLKKCNAHGKLYIDDVIKSGISKAGTQQYKCRKCMKEMHKRHYEMNKLLVKGKHKKYRDENKEKIALIKKKSRIKNKFKWLEESKLIDSYVRHSMELSRKKNARKNHKKQQETENLSDDYIRKLLTKRSSLKMNEIPQEMIECKKVLVQLRRGVQKKRDEQIYNLLEEKEENVKD